MVRSAWPLIPAHLGTGMMARFSVYRNKIAPFPPYLLQLQSELHDHMRSCVVVPLVPSEHVKGRSLARLLPEFKVEGEMMAMLTHELTSLPRKCLGTEVVSLSSRSVEITDAVDFLFQGF